MVSIETTCIKHGVDRKSSHRERRRDGKRREEKGQDNCKTRGEHTAREEKAGQLQDKENIRQEKRRQDNSKTRGTYGKRREGRTITITRQDNHKRRRQLSDKTIITNKTRQ
jgi:hypothetical protein